METKLYLFFLVALMVDVALGKYWITSIWSDAKRKELSLTEKENFEENVKPFLDHVTLNETSTVWHESNFRFCYNNVSYPYNAAVIDFRKESTKFLEKYHYDSRKKHHYLINEIKECAKNISYLLDDVRNEIFRDTYKKNFEVPLKEKLKNFKKQIKDKLLHIYANIETIQHTSYVDSQKKGSVENQKNIIKEFENIEKAAKTFVDSIKTCIKTYK